MAETIRYDASEDPVAAQAIAEKEAESLKVGEELMAKQDKMLAGKYKLSLIHISEPTRPY